MDRTEEFLRAAKIYQNHGVEEVIREPPRISEFTRTALKVSSYLDENENLVQKMEKL